METHDGSGVPAHGQVIVVDEQMGAFAARLYDETYEACDGQKLAIIPFDMIDDRDVPLVKPLAQFSITVSKRRKLPAKIRFARGPEADRLAGMIVDRPDGVH